MESFVETKFQSVRKCESEETRGVAPRVRCDYYGWKCALRALSLFRYFIFFFWKKKNINIIFFFFCDSFGKFCPDNIPKCEKRVRMKKREEWRHVFAVNIMGKSLHLARSLFFDTLYFSFEEKEINRRISAIIDVWS